MLWDLEAINVKCYLRQNNTPQKYNTLIHVILDDKQEIYTTTICQDVSRCLKMSQFLLSIGSNSNKTNISEDVENLTSLVLSNLPIA